MILVSFKENKIGFQICIKSKTIDCLIVISTAEIIKDFSLKSNGSFIEKITIQQYNNLDLLVLNLVFLRNVNNFHLFINLNLNWLINHRHLYKNTLVIDKFPFKTNKVNFIKTINKCIHQGFSLFYHQMTMKGKTITQHYYLK